MSFAKYLEDNMEMWEERNRDKEWRSKRETPPIISRIAADRTRNTNVSIRTSPRTNDVIVMKGI